MLHLCKNEVLASSSLLPRLFNWTGGVFRFSFSYVTREVEKRWVSLILCNRGVSALVNADGVVASNNVVVVLVIK